MGVKYLVSQVFVDPVLGPVRLRTLRTAVRYSARWKADGLHITIPVRTTEASFRRTLAEWAPRLLAIKPRVTSPLYFDGFSYAVFDWAFTIRAVQGWKQRCVGWERTDDSPATYIIKVSPLDDLSDRLIERNISKALMHVARQLAQKSLIPQAEAEARRLGLDRAVKSWSIGRGRRRMGACTASGSISLSAMLMFFPEETRRSTITHELAHLSHFDHSPAFYALWEAYLGHSHRLHRPDPSKAPLPQ